MLEDKILVLNARNNHQEKEMANLKIKSWKNEKILKRLLQTNSIVRFKRSQQQDSDVPPDKSVRVKNHDELADDSKQAEQNMERHHNQEQPDSQECGMSTATTHKITRGRNSVLGDWPWMAYITIEGRDDGKIDHCGGVLISNTHVLTAAHCFGKLK